MADVLHNALRNVVFPEEGLPTMPMSTPKSIQTPVVLVRIFTILIPETFNHYYKIVLIDETNYISTRDSGIRNTIII